MVLERTALAIKAITRASAYAGAVALLGCVAVTVVDVVKRNFLGSSVFGAVEYVQLGIMWGAFLTIPLGFAHGDHIAVDVFVARTRDAVKTALRAFNMLLAVLVLAACLYWGGEQAMHALTTRDLTLTAGLPMWLFWLPVLYGIGLSALAALVVMAQALAALRPARGARP